MDGSDLLKSSFKLFIIEFGLESSYVTFGLGEFLKGENTPLLTLYAGTGGAGRRAAAAADLLRQPIGADGPRVVGHGVGADQRPARHGATAGRAPTTGAAGRRRAAIAPPRRRLVRLWRPDRDQHLEPQLALGRRQRVRAVRPFLP